MSLRLAVTCAESCCHRYWRVEAYAWGASRVADSYEETSAPREAPDAMAAAPAFVLSPSTASWKAVAWEADSAWKPDESLER